MLQFRMDDEPMVGIRDGSRPRRSRTQGPVARPHSSRRRIEHVVEGVLELSVDGQGTRTVKAVADSRCRRSASHGGKRGPSRRDRAHFCGRERTVASPASAAYSAPPTGGVRVETWETVVLVRGALLAIGLVLSLNVFALPAQKASLLKQPRQRLRRKRPASQVQSAVQSDNCTEGVAPMHSAWRSGSISARTIVD